MAERETERKRILDPEGPPIRTCIWMPEIARCVSSIVSILFVYIPVIDHHNKCLDFDYTLAISLSVLRSVLDFLSLPFIILYSIKFLKDNMTPNSLLWNVWALLVIFIGAFSIAPLPQFHFFGFFANYHSPAISLYIAAFQSLGAMMSWQLILPRALMPQTFPDGRLPITLLWCAANYVYLCMLIINVVGASWYFLSIASELDCWGKELTIYHRHLIDAMTCGNLNQTQVSRLNDSCSFAGPTKTFDYGVFTAALELRIIEQSTNFSTKWFYSFFWALRTLSSFGQNLETSTDPGEIGFATVISILCMLSFTMVLGSLQNLYQYNNKKVEAKHMKENDTEAWMSRQNVPERLRKRIRQNEDYKWKSTWFVEQETLIRNLPKDIRMDLRRHLCWALVTKVPQFTRLMLMDPDFLHALCDRLKPILYIKNTRILLEGKPVEEMIFIKEGNLKTKAKDTQRPGSYIISTLKDGDFCGEELVAWALNPNSSSDHILPISTKTLETVSNVKAYVVLAEDLKSIASQLHFSYTSRLHNWPRTRVALKIQKAWSCHRQMRLEQSLSAAEATSQSAPVNAVGTSSPAGTTIHESRFATIESTSIWEKGESSNSSAT